MHPERRQETLAVANVDQPLTHARGNTTAGTRITTTTIVPTAVNTGPTSITRAAVRTWYGSEPTQPGHGTPETSDKPQYPPRTQPNLDRSNRARRSSTTSVPRRATTSTCDLHADTVVNHPFGLSAKRPRRRGQWGKQPSHGEQRGRETGLGLGTGASRFPPSHPRTAEARHQARRPQHPQSRSWPWRPAPCPEGDQ